MDIRVRTLRDDDHQAWDGFVARSSAGNFLHSRRFLSYHGQRFPDCSVVLHDERGIWCGVFPAALDSADPAIVVSHPGITYGGLVHSGELIGEDNVRAGEAICAFYAGQGKRLLRYKVVPSIYHRMPAQDDLYALFRLHARLYRRDLSCAIDLQARGEVSERRRRGLKKARNAGGLEIEYGFAAGREFWNVLRENLASRHDVNPVHTFEEIALLQAQFPDQIELVVAKQGTNVVAGVLLFETDRVSHSQYTASTETGRDLSALDAVFEAVIARAAAAGRRYFDFGVSTKQDGTELNEGLYAFKAGFGGAGVVHDFYEIELAQR
ncbi:MAG: GNAT family N-acetyltransferase [Betaproteobacteria bacterium]